LAEYTAGYALADLAIIGGAAYSINNASDYIYNASKGDVETDAPDGPFSWVDPGRKTTNDKLKEDWKNQTGEPWPVDPDTGKSQDASHEIPLADGGPDHVSNIQPRPGQEHQDLHASRGDRSRWGKRRWRKCP